MSSSPAEATRPAGTAVPIGSTEPEGRAALVWDAFCFVVISMVLVWGQLAARPVPAVGVAALLAIAALYVVFGRPLLRLERGERRGTAVAVAMLVLFAVALAASLSTAYLLFALCPLMFRIQPLRPAIVMVVGATLLPITVAVLQYGPTARVVAALGPRTAVAIPTALWLGYWIDRVTRQSHERARLIAELEASRAEIAVLSHEAGTTAERARLAGEIHDTLAQGFTSIITLLQAAKADLATDAGAAQDHLALAIRTARENLAESRAMIAELTPAALHDTDLVDALRRQTDALTEETGVAATTGTTGTVRALPTAVQVVLLRAAQEALANVRRHAAAAEVAVRLAYTTDAVRLVVRDDGRGFDPVRPGTGYGLAGMRARAEQVNGTLAVHSSPDTGTTIEVSIPT
ncbi:sensor histidine kinase [Jidongwangia harbinensis]|uniref:sensor histidine kinase n=1 Tax=Jidongwangia harbinensis TaxID=2878561 RepID=UPI001CD9B52E|nr:sensor histidine kinase [Jidongwangia harbinensis]MCA2214138.1 sensor histidine kinase [Jidongwangia harbinensis]